MNESEWIMEYQIGEGIFTLRGEHDWLMSQWNVIVANNPGVKLISFDLDI